MQKLQFTIDIHAPADKVYDAMLGLSNKSTYDEWTSIFGPTSTYEGKWEQGHKIYFTSIDKQGEIMGMVAEVVEIKENEFVSIKHYGLLKGSEEITTGPEVEKWANSLENYTFVYNNGVTSLTVDMETSPEFAVHLTTPYPKALLKLKEICERA